MIKLGLSFQKIVLEWFYDNWLRSYNGSKLQEDKIFKNRNFSVFWNTKISEISESENFGTQGLHLMYLRPLGGGGELELFFARAALGGGGGKFLRALRAVIFLPLEQILFMPLPMINLLF